MWSSAVCITNACDLTKIVDGEAIRAVGGQATKIGQRAPIHTRDDGIVSAERGDISSNRP